MLATLVELGVTDDWQHMIDISIVRGHSQVAGAKGACKEGFGRSRGGFTSKIHARWDGWGRPHGFVLTGGEVSDYRAVPTLLDIPVTHPKAMPADKGYDGNTVREALLRAIKSAVKYRRFEKRNLNEDHYLCGYCHWDRGVGQCRRAYTRRRFRD